MEGRAGTVVNKFVMPDVAAVRGEAAGIDARAFLDDPKDFGGYSRAALALALWSDSAILTGELKAAAEKRCSTRRPALYAFTPLYTTNYCDSECKMCSMRRGNVRMERKFAGRDLILDQLQVLYRHEGVRGVGLVTGEYEDKYTRLSTAFRIGWAARAALDMGFEQVYINIGSMDPEEIDVFGEWVSREDPIMMGVFQETYYRDTYQAFMGSTSEDVPKANFDRRVVSFDAWLDAGFKQVNPGVLVGLHEDLTVEMVNLIAHAEHLGRRGANVHISLPRMRPASVSRSVARVGDEDYLRLMSVVAFVCSDQRLILTTREPEEFQEQVIDLVGVFSPGSPDVGAYDSQTRVRNREESSQFIVADIRRPREIFLRLRAGGREVRHFVDPTL